MAENSTLLASLGIAALISLVVTVFFCITLSKTLKMVGEANRKMHPNAVWLLMIPGFNFVWNFFVASRVADSIENELESRDYDVEERPGFSQGMLYAVTSCLAVVPSFVPIPPAYAFFAGVIGIAQLVFFIQYWMKVNWYRAVLSNDELEKTE